MDSTRKVVKGTLRDRYWTLNGPAAKETRSAHSDNIRLP